MIDSARSWFKDNQTLVYFLVGQAIAFGAAMVSGTAYMTRLDARVEVLENRGSPHLAVIDNRLTVLEAQTKSNKDSIERIVDTMTKKLNINP